MEAIIVDAGPLVAYLERADRDHAWSRAQFKLLHDPLITCDAVLSEAFFLLRQSSGGGEKLLQLLERKIVLPAFDLAAELARVSSLMRCYETVPMSLADACLVRMAELHEPGRVFTLDSDFKIYRKNRR